MAARSGKDGRILIGTFVVAELESWDWSGITVEVIEHGALEHTHIQKHPGISNSGTVEMVGNYDPDDTTGQDILLAAAEGRTILTTCFLGLDVSGTSQWEPNLTADSSACMVITKAVAIGVDQAGMMKVAITAELGGAWLLV